ncbi:MAG TPA: alkaline phosphatase PhoX, partial [Myxococcota bacterium]
NIDNVTVSPRGGLLLCEDNGNGEGTRLVGITPDGVAYPFAVNQVEFATPPPGKTVTPGNYRSSEWAGCCFDPSGRWLFANIYNPGITFAISGPWARGPL